MATVLEHVKEDEKLDELMGIVKRNVIEGDVQAFMEAIDDPNDEPLGVAVAERICAFTREHEVQARFYRELAWFFMEMGYDVVKSGRGVKFSATTKENTPKGRFSTARATYDALEGLDWLSVSDVVQKIDKRNVTPEKVENVLSKIKWNSVVDLPKDFGEALCEEKDGKYRIIPAKKDEEVKVVAASGKDEDSQEVQTSEDN